MNKVSIYCLAALCLMMACKQESTSIKAEYKKLTEAVYASGNILPKDDHQLFADASGFLVKRLVNEGDVVKKGQVLFVLQSRQQELRTEAAKTAYQVAEVNAGTSSPVLAELKINLDKAKTKLQNDSINYFRQKQLFDKQATSKVQLEQATLSYQVAKQEVLALETKLRQTENSLLVEMKNAESQYHIQTDVTQNHQIVSDMDGVVFEIYRETGELMRKNEPIALIGAKNETYVKLAVDELDISKIQTGQAILLKIDVYPNQTFQAKVSKIYPMMDKRDQSFRVDAVLTEAFKTPYAGLNVEANIIIKENNEALVLPKVALVGTDSVWVLDDSGEKKKVKIELGTVTMEYVEVLSGIDTSTSIWVE